MGWHTAATVQQLHIILNVGSWMICKAPQSRVGPLPSHAQQLRHRNFCQKTTNKLYIVPTQKNRPHNWWNSIGVDCTLEHHWATYVPK